MPLPPRLERGRDGGPTLQPLISLDEARPFGPLIGKRRGVSLRALGAGTPAATLAEAQTGSRPVWFDGGWVETPVYARERLPLGARFEGPAIIEQLDATTVVEPGNRVERDAFGNLVLTV